MTVVTLRKLLIWLNMHRLPDLRPSLRIHAVGLAILLCATLAFIALDGAEHTWTRIFFGVFGIPVSVLLVHVYRKEASLAYNHMIVAGVITAIKTRPRRRQRIKYRFVALNGVEYTGKSDWQGRTNRGAEIVVLYNPLQPATNQPLKRFLFYSFRTYGS